MSNNPADWLEQFHSNGIELGVEELLHYQQFSRLLDLTPRKMPQALLAGTYLTRHKGRGMEFDEARHYQPGDDIRAIDWRVTARTGKTHTKVYREERERPVFVLVDLSHSMQFGTQLLLKSVQAAHLATIAAWSATARGDKIGALVFNDEQHRECKPMTRQRAVLRLCHELIELQRAALSNDTARDPDRLSSALARLRRLARPGSLVYLISDFNALDERAIAHVTHLSRHCEVQAWRITDPFEFDLPDSAVVQPVAVTDGAERRTLLLGDTATQQDYAKFVASREQKLQQQLQLAHCALHHISAALPLTEQLLARQGGRR